MSSAMPTTARFSPAGRVTSGDAARDSGGAAGAGGGGAGRAGAAGFGAAARVAGAGAVGRGASSASSIDGPAKAERRRQYQ